MQIPPEWLEAVDRVRKLPDGATALLIGGTDRGKSTFAALAARLLSEEEFSIAIVDADIGQGEIGPPGTVGIAWASDRSAKLAELKPAAVFFVGAFSASALPLEHVTATVNAVRHARLRDAGRILVDTTGYVSGPQARRLKAAKASLIRPELILAFAADSDRDTALTVATAAATCSAEVVSVPVPMSVQRKPPAMRTTRRQTRLAAYFGDVQETVALSLSAMTTMGATIGTGVPIAAHLSEWAGKALGVPVSYGEIASDVLSLFVEGPVRSGWESRTGPIADHFKVTSVRIVSLDAYRGLLVGLHGEDGHLLSLGRIRDFDRERNGIRVETPSSVAKSVSERTRLIQFGRVRGDSSGATLSEVKPNEL